MAFLFADPLSTAVVEKGLTSRGLSVEKARKLVNNERRMRCQFLDEVEDFLWQGGDAVSSKVSLMLAMIKGAEIEM